MKTQKLTVPDCRLGGLGISAFRCFYKANLQRFTSYTLVLYQARIPHWDLQSLPHNFSSVCRSPARQCSASETPAKQRLLCESSWQAEERQGGRGWEMLILIQMQTKRWSIQEQTTLADGMLHLSRVHTGIHFHFLTAQKHLGWTLSCANFAVYFPQVPMDGTNLSMI